MLAVDGSLGGHCFAMNFTIIHEIRLLEVPVGDFVCVMLSTSDLLLAITDKPVSRVTDA